MWWCCLRALSGGRALCLCLPVWVGVVFGNRIADASIFACLALWGGACLLGVCRAFGGCLGIKGRRRTWQSAISLGELASER